MKPCMMAEQLPTEKKICYVLLSVGTGGLEKVVFDLALDLPRDKFSPLICCIENKGERAIGLEKKGIPVYLVKKKRGVDLTLPFYLAHFFKKNNVSIIHSHTKNAFFYCALASLISGIPLVNTRHGKNNPESKKRILMNRFASLISKKVITVCDSAKMIVEQIEKVPTFKVRTIYNGVDTKFFQVPRDRSKIKAEFGFQNSDFIIGNVARISIEKNHRLLIDAFVLVREQESCAKLMIVGDGPLTKEIKKYAASSEFSSDIIFTGNRNDILHLLSMFNVFVLSSLTEGLSISILEAMASKLPVIATDVGGNRELVVDEVTGLLVPYGSAEVLAKAIMRLLADPDLAKKMAEAGRKRVLEKFSLERMTREYMEVYKEILEKK